MIDHQDMLQIGCRKAVETYGLEHVRETGGMRRMVVQSCKHASCLQVWICGLPHEYSEADIRSYWDECGPIEALDLLSFKDSGRFNGTCFITFRTQASVWATYCACPGHFNRDGGDCCVPMVHLTCLSIVFCEPCACSVIHHQHQHTQSYVCASQ